MGKTCIHLCPDFNIMYEYAPVLHHDFTSFMGKIFFLRTEYKTRGARSGE